MSKKECLCGLDGTGLRRDIVCPKHDGERVIPWPICPYVAHNTYEQVAEGAARPLPGGDLTANDWN